MHDLIIVGGGPAGATCARKAAFAGLDVLVIERSTYPRQKPCGGGITPRVARLVDFDLTPAVDRIINTAVIHSPSGKRVLCQRDHAAGYMVRRERFDEFLVEQARRAGAEVLEGLNVVALEQVRRGVRVLCPGDSFKSHLLVGADGVNGIIAREIGIRWHWPEHKVALCISGEVKLSTQRVEEVMSLEDNRASVAMEIFLGVQERGYGWCFPKRDSLSIGIGCRMDYLQDLQSEWIQFINRLESEKGVHLPIVSQSSFRVPLGTEGPRLIGRRAMLVGDAAGLVSPVTGEGIYYAMHSGNIAAETAIEAVTSKRPMQIKRYEDRVKAEILPELKLAESISKILFKSSYNADLICEIALRDEVMKNLMVDFVTGARPYLKLKYAITKRLLTYHPLKATRLGIGH